jgi:crotonobetainyl-CoA:carnitine CoA-transferase CaiB-like acyl-CoA transferase
MADWRLDYASFESINPGLVVTSITPFGWTGPYRDYLGNDLLAWHASGAGHHFLGDPDRAPLRPPFYHAEHWAGVCAASASLIALEIMEVLGEGQHVDISVADVFVVLVMGYQLPTLFHDRGVTARRKGVEFRTHAPAGMLRCKDGYVFIMTLGEGQWGGLRRAMGNPAWADEPLFDVPAWERVAYADEILALMDDWLMNHTKEEIFRLCQANRVPATAVYDTSELVLQPHLDARGFWVDLPTTDGRMVRAPGAPYLFSETPWRLRRRAPKRGENNPEVLQGQLGFSRAQLARLWQAGII